MSWDHLPRGDKKWTLFFVILVVGMFATIFCNGAAGYKWGTHEAGVGYLIGTCITLACCALITIDDLYH